MNHEYEVGDVAVFTIQTPHVTYTKKAFLTRFGWLTEDNEYLDPDEIINDEPVTAQAAAKPDISAVLDNLDEILATVSSLAPLFGARRNGKTTLMTLWGTVTDTIDKLAGTDTPIQEPTRENAVVRVAYHNKTVLYTRTANNLWRVKGESLQSWRTWKQIADYVTEVVSPGD